MEWRGGDGAQHDRGVEGGDLVIGARQKFATDELFGPAIDAGEVEGRGQDAAEFTCRDHLRYPPPAAAWRSGDDDNGGAFRADRRGTSGERLRARCLW